MKTREGIYAADPGANSARCMPETTRQSTLGSRQTRAARKAHGLAPSHDSSLPDLHTETDYVVSHHAKI